MIIRKCLEDISADFVPDMTTCLLKVREDSQGFLLPVLLEFVAACWRNLEMDLKLNIRFFLCCVLFTQFILYTLEQMTTEKTELYHACIR